MSAVIVKGFRVVEADTDGKNKKTLSKMFTVKEAALQYVQLARKAGHAEATLETIYGHDDAGPIWHAD